ncbi:(2Fe-2S)-binding protein [Saccharothrix sp. ALI-22-I]|uniref:(2Fe-2S)-binding protein n=1 Tax=Saccharothrix sp. ALI-22-I TaxID=1933778 RepID=UPI00097C8840|nr:(2Fe-2S)-binding protein [Saccharothrix sp. ALI-22-I]ONI84587.1 (2Fe-2S)-binding protein [Saccharothrix sp. ALI-22-I]
MYVCICAAVSDTQVRACIRNGARTVEEIGERCQAGTGCGTCLDHLDGMLEQDLAPSNAA